MSSETRVEKLKRKRLQRTGRQVFAPSQNSVSKFSYCEFQVLVFAVAAHHEGSSRGSLFKPSSFNQTMSSTDDVRLSKLSITRPQPSLKARPSKTEHKIKLLLQQTRNRENLISKTLKASAKDVNSACLCCDEQKRKKTEIFCFWPSAAANFHFQAFELNLRLEAQSACRLRGLFA